VLLVMMHHIITDGWSMRVLLREIAASTAPSARRASPLPELPVQYADYATGSGSVLGGERLERQLAYWREQLPACPPLLELPTDRPRPPVQSYRGASLGAPLPEPLRRCAAEPPRRARRSS
jgi:hypothetical protein